jgi:acetyltransferase-like isoleucine patch superfamily enzyme
MRAWAPDYVRVGNNVYIGRDVHIECNVSIEDFAIIANRVAFVGREDHDIYQVGVPIRFSTWIGARRSDDPIRQKEVHVGKDVWIGFGAILLTGVKIGRGAVVAAGSVVASDIDPYAIVAGIPARKIGERFTSEQIEKHEKSLELGRFAYSARGWRHWTVQPNVVDSVDNLDRP